MRESQRTTGFLPRPSSPWVVRCSRPHSFSLTLTQGAVRGQQSRCQASGGPRSLCPRQRVGWAGCATNLWLRHGRESGGHSARKREWQKGVGRENPKLKHCNKNLEGAHTATPSGDKLERGTCKGSSFSFNPFSDSAPMPPRGEAFGVCCPVNLGSFTSVPFCPGSAIKALGALWGHPCLCSRPAPVPSSWVGLGCPWGWTCQSNICLHGHDGWSLGLGTKLAPRTSPKIGGAGRVVVEPWGRRSKVHGSLGWGAQLSWLHRRPARGSQGPRKADPGSGERSRDTAQPTGSPAAGLPNYRSRSTPPGWSHCELASVTCERGQQRLR